MSNYWANFAKTGDPNGAQMPKWEPYSHEKPLSMILDANAYQMSNIMSEKPSYWLFKEKLTAKEQK